MTPFDPAWPRPRRAVAEARRALPAELGTVLDFWFGAPEAEDYGANRPPWFAKDDAFDRAIRDRFAALHERLQDGAMAELVVDPDAALALIVALDQFPRNMFRGSPRMYASDERARALATAAVGAGIDRLLVPVERWFVYLPLEHSERLDDQERALGLIGDLAWHEPSRKAFESAGRHHAIVARFGRFPHRNAVLGRASTAEEEAFLMMPGSSF
ncbi:MAG: DUF924 family protein [Alphaproteobacteria bacterium]